MKKAIITIGMSLAIATMASAQLKVTSTGDVLFPQNTFIKAADGSISLQANHKIFFGCDALGNNPNWSIQYWDGGLNFWKPNGSTNEGDFKLFLKDNGNVGIGVSPSSYKLDVLGNVRFTSSDPSKLLTFNVGNDDPRICAVNKVVFYKWDNSGFISVDAKIINESSDSTKKKEIKPIKSSLNKILKLKGYNYYWKDDIKNTEKQSGLLAQEVENIIPEVVTTADSSKGKMISYTHLVPYIIEAIKEQNGEIDSLKTIVNILATQNRTLTDQLTDIQNCCNTKNGKLKSDTEESDTQTQTQTQTQAKATVAVDNSIQSSQLSQTSQTDVARLYQNAPNPFKQSTTIRLEIPQTVGSAMVCIYDLTGKQLKCLTVSGRGATSVEIFANELTAGMYHYALIADGVLIDTKTMVLTE